MFILCLKARSHNQLLDLVLLVEKEIFVNWKGDLHNGNCVLLLLVGGGGETFVYGGVF